jgi:hypothetical protein
VADDKLYAVCTGVPLYFFFTGLRTGDEEDKVDHEELIEHTILATFD